MQRREIDPPIMRAYVNEIGLTWDVIFIQDPLLKGNQRLYEVWSNAEERLHGICISPDVVVEHERCLPDLLQALCRSYLAEKVDVAFASLFFSSEDRMPEQEFSRLSHKLDMAWSVTAVWANDIMMDVWPEVFQEGSRAFESRLRDLHSQGEWTVLASFGVCVSICQHVADMRRHFRTGYGLPPDYVGSAREWMERLTSYYENLPRLEFTRKDDLEKLEKAVQGAVSVYEFGITPRLIEEDGRMVWRI